jgi:peroxiredoxin
VDAVVAAVVGLLGVAVVVLVYMIYKIVGQQGRMLVRLDSLEQYVAGAAGFSSANGQPVAPAGLAVGTPVPSFRLPDVNGETVALEDFRGRRLLLVHWSPNCGFCDQIAPELATLQGDLRKRNTELLLVSYGDSESNRRLAAKSGLDCPILLHPDDSQLDAFTHLGTPVAYLVDEQGRVAEPIAIGANDVPVLARDAAQGRRRLASERPLGESRIMRDGLSAGTPAPLFSLPDLAGRTVSLEEYRGRRVLLIFSDPHCGPCDALAPQLGRFHREHGDRRLALLMVTRGERKENRRKAEEHGLEFPVVIQPRWKLSKQYGIFATPVAFLVDEEGVIATDVAPGADEILALARAEFGNEREEVRIG